MNREESGLGCSILHPARWKFTLDPKMAAQQWSKNLARTTSLASALLDDGPRSASVVATEETVCMILNRIDFISLMMKDAEMGVLIATELAKRIRKLLESV